MTVLKDLWETFLLIVFLTIVSFFGFYGTLALSGGNFSLAIKVVIGIFSFVGVVRVVCAVLDSNWYQSRKPVPPPKPMIWIHAPGSPADILDDYRRSLKS